MEWQVLSLRPRYALLIGACVVCCGTYALLRFWGGTQNGVDHHPAQKATPEYHSEIDFPVVGITAVRGNLSIAISANGVVRGERDLDLVARVGGTIDSLGGTNGLMARKGDILLRLDPREFKISLEKARTSLVSAQIEYRTYSGTPFLERARSSSVREMLEQVHAKVDELEHARLDGRIGELEYIAQKRDLEADEAYYSLSRGDVISSRSGLNLASENYERAKLILEWSEIRAPFDGAVANCTLVPHMTISAGSVVCRLVDVSRLVVDVQLLESDAGKIRIGNKADIEVPAFPGDVFHGVVSTVNPCVDAKSHTLLVTLGVLQKDTPPLHTLRSGMVATVRLESQVLRDRIIVPVSSVLVRDEKPLVFIARGGVAKWQEVTLGQQNETQLEILSGIANGDTVLVAGHYTLAHDAPIRLRMLN
jgi:membrane fusion protein, multidrug efflux system